MSRTGRREAGTGWEQTTLRALTYPANLAFAGFAGFLLALPVVTALPAAVAVTRSLDGWRREDSTTVFTSTFREFAATWRRTLPLGVLAVVVVGFLAFDAWFLWAHLTSGTSGLGLAVGAASVPVAIAVALVLLAFPVAAAHNREGTTKQWLAEAGFLVTSRPLQATGLLLLTAAIGTTLTLLPAMAPFFGLSLPLYLALVSLVGPSPSSTAPASPPAAARARRRPTEREPRPPRDTPR